MAESIVEKCTASLRYKIVHSRHLAVSAVLMCVFSSLIALIYLVMNAPDVAITEAYVGAGLSTIFTFAALCLKKNHKGNLSHNTITLFYVISACMFVIFYDSITRHWQQQCSNPLACWSEKAIGIPNIVTAALASFCGYDTLGETIVVFAAALCITFILKEEQENY